jgi:hypothetical protein
MIRKDHIQSNTVIFSFSKRMSDTSAIQSIPFRGHIPTFEFCGFYSNNNEITTIILHRVSTHFLRRFVQHSKIRSETVRRIMSIVGK